LYFSEVLWPEFDDHELQTAIDWYAQRVRRFGKTDEQIKGSLAHQRGALQSAVSADVSPAGNATHSSNSTNSTTTRPLFLK
jgi:pantothenate kinase